VFFVFGKSEEDIKKREFGTVMRNLHREEQDLGKLRTSLQNHEQYMASHAEGRVCVRDLQNNFNYARALDGKILFQKKRVKEKKKIVGQQAFRTGRIDETQENSRAFERKVP